MNKPTNSAKQAKLKSQANRSHNLDSPDAQIIALVRLMARRAAEEDYRKRAAKHQPDKGGN